MTNDEERDAELALTAAAHDKTRREIAEISRLAEEDRRLLLACIHVAVAHYDLSGQTHRDRVMTRQAVDARALATRLERASLVVLVDG